MTDAERTQDHSPRLARVEERTARIEERLDGDREVRKEWRDEVLRRLAELNNHSAKLDAERINFLSKETFEARASSIEHQLDSRTRELTGENRGLIDRMDRKLQDHEITDNANHKEHGNDIEQMKEWINNQKGRQWALGIAVTLVSGLIAVIVQVVFHLMSTK